MQFLFCVSSVLKNEQFLFGMCSVLNYRPALMKFLFSVSSVLKNEQFLFGMSSVYSCILPSRTDEISL